MLSLLPVATVHERLGSGQARGRGGSGRFLCDSPKNSSRKLFLPGDVWLSPSGPSQTLLRIIPTWGWGGLKKKKTLTIPIKCFKWSMPHSKLRERGFEGFSRNKNKTCAEAAEMPLKRPPGVWNGLTHVKDRAAARGGGGLLSERMVAGVEAAPWDVPGGFMI